MFVEHKFYVGLSDVNINKELTNTSLLKHLEDVAGIHSEIAGFGLTDIEKTRRSWILLGWKVKVLKRPLVNDTVIIKTWSRSIDKFYAFRDFEIRDQYDDIVAIATSKWIFIDIDKGKIVKVTDDVIESYKQENKQVFEEYDLPKLKEPENFELESDFKITRNLIDINKHVHNIHYLDIAKECMPEDICFGNELNEFEITYKKEIKLGDIVKAEYKKEDDYHYITIKSIDKSTIHSIIKLK